MSFFRFALALLALPFVAGCAGIHYTPPSFDAKAGRYSAIATVERSNIKVRNTAIDISKYKFILLNVQSNVHPARLEYALRDVINRAGFSQVVNKNEFMKFALKSKNPKLAEMTHPDLYKAIASEVGPFLSVEARAIWPGGAQRFVALRVTDIQTGETLLEINHPKTIWISVDGEAHYPIYNELHAWLVEVTNKKTRS
jgi:hypothetical protein